MAALGESCHRGGVATFSRQETGNRMTAFTLSAADVREVGLSDYSTRVVFRDPSLSKITRFGPRGGNGTQLFVFRQLLPALRRRPKFTAKMERRLAALDKERRAKGSK